MASYPNSPITFTTRSNGQTIDASHINAVQEEVAAIEAGLLGATAPVVSSHATVTGLQVTGPSTFAGSIQVNGLAIVQGATTLDTLQVNSGSTMASVYMAGSLLVDGTAQFLVNDARFESTNGGPVLRLARRLTSTPAAPTSTGAAVIYLGDNGAGKTQLLVRFNSGAAQVIATEP